jgi:hypothetical protein
MLHLYRPTLLVLIGLLVGACASPPPPAYNSEAFNADSPFRYWSTKEPDVACELGRRALLSQGYQVDDAKPQTIRGEKLFQPQPDYVMKLNITLVCLPSNVGAGLYANALQTRFELKSRGNSAGVSVTGIGSISLPWSNDKDVMVKVGEETIADPTFYRRLFALIDALGG